MNEIKNHCHAYQQHLSASDSGDPLGAMKKKIVTELLEKNNPQDILSLLSRQTSALKLTGRPKYSSYEQILRMRRSSWLRDIVMGLLLVLTFPISIPFLMIWSRTTHGDINFLKPDGVIFVEKLRFLCEQAMPNTSLRRNPVNNPKPVDNYRSLLPKVDLKPRATYRSPEAPSNAGMFDSFLADIFHPDNDLRDTGKPETLSFRVQPFSSSEDSSGRVDIFCKFRFIPNLGRAASLKFWIDLRPGYRRDESNIPTTTLLETLETQERMEDNIKEPMGYVKTIQSYFFRPKQSQTFTTIYAAIQENRCDYYDGSRLALSLAKTDIERVMALEALINILKRKYDYHCKKAKEAQAKVEFSAVRTQLVEAYLQGRFTPSIRWSKETIETWILKNEEHLKFHNRTLWEDDLIKAQYWAQDNTNKSERFLQELTEALDSLPANYHHITPSANQLQTKINLMFRLLEENKIGDAKLLYKQNAKLSYFLEAAFPHFKALLEQFKGIFALVSELGAYSMIGAPHEPEDAELVKNQLLIYYKENQIWVATRNSDNAVQRFAIDNHKLGKHVGAILYAFEQGDGYDSYIEVLEPILAKDGYYSRLSQSVLVAKDCFSNAYEQILTYDPELAERFKRDTLDPVEVLVDFGQDAKGKTPLDTQRQMIALLKEQSRKEMLSGEVVERISLMSDAAWDEVLAEGGLSLQREDAASSRLKI